MSGFFKRLMKSFLTVAILLGVLLFIFWTPITTRIVSARLGEAIGMPVEAENIRRGLGKPTLEIEGLTIYNTDDFGGGVFVRVPRFFVKWDSESIGNGVLDLDVVELDVAELHLVENQAGESNWDVIQAKDYSPDFEFEGIASLLLSIGEVHKSKLGGESKRYEINLRDERLTDVDELSDLVPLTLKIGLKAGMSLLSF